MYFLFKMNRGISMPVLILNIKTFWFHMILFYFRDYNTYGHIHGCILSGIMREHPIPHHYLRKT